MIKRGEGYQRLFQAMAEELKLPLLQIARQAELAQGEPNPELLKYIEQSAAQALWLVDSYTLSQQLADQQQLALEPVAVSAALDDAAHALGDLAKQYNCELSLQLSGRYRPVMAHRQALHTALVGLGSSLIIASPQTVQKTPVVLAAHRGRDGGVVAGIYSPNEGLSQTIFQQGKALYGRSRQPMQTLSAQAGAGIFIAESLFCSMATELRVARHHKLTGLAATLPASQQLGLI
jgi:hypothetical protein